jgi:hypothetical protein
MKFVFLAIFVLFAALPVQATGCDMQQSQGASHSSHTEMPGHDMDDGDGADMDCCDHDPSVPSDECDPMSHCGAATAGVASIDSSTVDLIFSVGSRQCSADTGAPLNNYSSPPFRPPIA